MLYFLGFIILILGGVLLVPVPAAFLFGEAYQVPYFLIPAAVALALGLLMRRRFPRVELSLGHAMVVVALAWIIACLFSVVPYMLGTTRLRDGRENPTPMGFVDSYFESMSGFTATGLTMIPTDNASTFNIETTPMTVLFWRSLTGWVGGLGVVVLFLAALIGAGRAARKLYVAEARVERIEPSIRETAKSLWMIYALLTLVGVLGFFLIGGMGVFESINHGMTAIATCGFAVRNASFADYGTPAILVGVVIMFLGATSFAVHRRAFWGRRWREFFKNVEVRLMLALIAIVTLALVLSVGLTHSLFQSTSAITGTGFSTTNVAGWGDLPRGALTILMVIGGGYGSTSSAIKLIRWVIILKAVHWSIKRSFLPERAVVPMKVAGRVYTHEEVMETSIYAFIYILVLVMGAIIIAMLGYPMVNAMFESASAQGNVGLSVGIASAVPVAGQVVLIIQMLVGRLEIIPVIALLSYFITRIPRPRA